MRTKPVWKGVPEFNSRETKKIHKALEKIGRKPLALVNDIVEE
ncbi:MAG: hypothetical protein ACUVS1_07035 [Actinomycetota bacterium]